MLPLENPYLEWLGARLVAWRVDYAEMHLDLTPNLENRTGRVQGGVICTMLDAVAGYAGLHPEGNGPPRQSVTLSLTTNFLSTGNGQLLVAKGFIERKGKGIYFSRGEVYIDGAILLATALGTFKYLRVTNQGAKSTGSQE